MSQELVRAPCGKCLSKTDHLILFQKSISDSEPYDEEFSVYWEDSYRLLECCGCHSIVLHRLSTFSEVDGYSEAYYPPGATRRPPSWVSRLPPQIKALLDEVYLALDNNCLQLALMGSRALLDRYLVDEVGDFGNFSQKLAEMVTKHLLSDKHKSFLETALDAGHAVMHRAFEPKRSLVDEVMDILESFLHGYVAQDSLEDLRSAIPARKSTKKKAT